MRVGIGQINSTVGDIDGNAKTITSRIVEAREAGCDLVLFPEFALPGQSPLDLVWRSGFVEACEEAMDVIRRQTDGIAAVVGSVAPCKIQQGESDAALSNCAYAMEDRSILARVDKMGFTAGNVGDDKRYFSPCQGTQTIDLAGHRLGLSLGHRIGDGTADILAGLEAEWILHAAASPFRAGIQAERLRLASQAARESGLGIVFANCVGGQDTTVFDGGSFVVGPDGRPRFRADRFEEGLFVIDLDASDATPAKEESALPEKRAAIILGIHDYVRKNGFSAVIVGISGGIDSALVAALAVEALGPSAVTGVYLPCEHSSDESRADARALSSNLGIELLEISARGVHEALRSALPFDAAGIVDENLQARSRATLWMALANERDALVLATGNKSETAVGYFTLYGDATGALAPIGDLYKYEVRQLAASFEGRVPQKILEKAPSAELRPDHRDEDDLPPYEILDPLLEALIDENASREELIARGLGAELVDEVLVRYYRSEFKRRQAPPALSLTASSFGERGMPLTHTFRR